MVLRAVCGIFALLLLIPAMLIAASPSRPVTVPFVLDHNRVFVDVEFRQAAGKLRSARAFVDMGAPDFTFAEDLANELRLGQAKETEHMAWWHASPYRLHESDRRDLQRQIYSDGGHGRGESPHCCSDEL